MTKSWDVWARRHNDWPSTPWCPGAVSKNDGASCPAERLNGKRYSDCRLTNLLTATSLGGTKKLPLKVRNNQEIFSPDSCLAGL